MICGHALTHELAFDRQNERDAACTEAIPGLTSRSVIGSMRRAFGAGLISLGERLSGTRVIASTAGAR
jgi:hypothetical protein